jgi:hypothetical protein
MVVANNSSFLGCFSTFGAHNSLISLTIFVKKFDKFIAFFDFNINLTALTLIVASASE